MRLQVNGGGSVYLSGPTWTTARDVRLLTRDARAQRRRHSSVDGEGGTAIATVRRVGAHLRAGRVRRWRSPGSHRPTRSRSTGDDVVNGLSRATRPGRATRRSHRLRPRVHFFRPLRDAEDANARDTRHDRRDGDLAVQMTTTNDTVREVIAQVDDTTPDRASTGFSAHVSDAPGGVDFTFSWDFGDGELRQARARATRVRARPLPGHGHRRRKRRVQRRSSPLDVQVGTPSASPDALRDAGGGRQQPAGRAGRPRPGGGGPRPGAARGGQGPAASGPSRAVGREGGERALHASPTRRPNGRAPAGDVRDRLDTRRATDPRRDAGAGAGGAPSQSSTAKPPTEPPSARGSRRGERVDGIVLARAGSVAGRRSPRCRPRGAGALAGAPRRRRRCACPGWVGGAVCSSCCSARGSARGGLRWRTRARDPRARIGRGHRLRRSSACASRCWSWRWRRSRWSSSSWRPARRASCAAGGATRRLEQAAVAARAAEGDDQPRPARSAAPGAASSDAMAAAFARVAGRTARPAPRPDRQEPGRLRPALAAPARAHPDARPRRARARPDGHVDPALPRALWARARRRERYGQPARGVLDHRRSACSSAPPRSASRSCATGSTRRISPTSSSSPPCWRSDDPRHARMRASAPTATATRSTGWSTCSTSGSCSRWRSCSPRCSRST